MVFIQNLLFCMLLLNSDLNHLYIIYINIGTRNFFSEVTHDVRQLK